MKHLILFIFCVSFAFFLQRDFEINKNFNQEKLGKDAKVWYKRLTTQMVDPNQASNYTKTSESNCVYQYGRTLNSYVSMLLMVFRFTGDGNILKRISVFTEIMRSKLKDWSIITLGGSTYEADGYLNWLWLADTGSYGGTDVHEMDEIMTHSFVVAFTYAFCSNSKDDTSYEEQCNFWKDYLKNHFEKKWRERKSITSGKFLEKPLTHPYVQWIRYHYYMYKMFDEQWYLDEAVRRVNVIKQQFIEVKTKKGTKAFVWDHRTTFESGDSMFCQPWTYCRYTISAITDLAFEDFEFQKSWMEKFSRTLSDIMMLDDEGLSYGKDCCSGEELHQGLPPYDGSDGTEDGFLSSPYCNLAAWDKKDRIREISTKVYERTVNDKENPRHGFIPGCMALSYLFEDYKNEKKKTSVIVAVVVSSVAVSLFCIILLIVVCVILIVSIAAGYFRSKGKGRELEKI